ncbi:MAG: DUF167 domain-containing protein [Capsulimonadaceae bacterium]
MKKTSLSARLSIRVTPRASRNQATAYSDGVLHLRLTAPPVDGAANAACCAFVAEMFDVPKSSVWVVSGAHSRTKVVEIEGVDANLVAVVIRSALEG